jgi:hypothetical protein
MTSTFDQIKEAWTRLDVLVLNASGGLEKDKPADDDSTERRRSGQPRQRALTGSPP